MVVISRSCRRIELLFCQSGRQAEAGRQAGQEAGRHREYFEMSKGRGGAQLDLAQAGRQAFLVGRRLSNHSLSAGVCLVCFASCSLQGGSQL